MVILMSGEGINLEETGNVVKESIAESQIMEQLNMILRNVEDIYRELVHTFKDLDNGYVEAVSKRYSRIRATKDDVENQGINLMEYVLRVSPTLTFKDVYVSVIQDLVRATEHGEAAAYRNLLLSSKEFERMPDELYALLDSMLTKLIDMLDINISMLEKVGYNNKVFRELYIKLIKDENSVDDLYREGGLLVLRSYGKDVGALILIKELLDKLEDAADIMKRVGTYLRYISLQK